MKKALVWFLLNILIIINGNLFAQSFGAQLIPRQVYVGDLAILVLPLPATEQNYPDIILTQSSLPFHENIDFRRIILEQRTTGSRLIIEFSAFVPGVHELPEIEIGGEYFSGLSVRINSIIEGRSDRVLSRTASTLAMPGTALMLYGSMAILVFLLLFTIWFIVKGHVIFLQLREKWKRYRLFASIRKSEKQLRKSIIKGSNNRIILDKLSESFRDFLSTLTGNNCRAMTAKEFETILTQEEGLFLGNYFRSCDELRFSGKDINSEDILNLLTDLRQFVGALDIIKSKETQKEEKAA